MNRKEKYIERQAKKDRALTLCTSLAKLRTARERIKPMFAEETYRELKKYTPNKYPKYRDATMKLRFKELDLLDQITKEFK